jgi:hypothetical protein
MLLYYLFFPTEVFKDNTYDILIFDQVVFRLSLGSPKGSINIGSYIYHGFLLICPTGFLRGFAWYIDILWIFSHKVFPKIQDYD